jgi:hypothetical protein
MLVDVTRVRLRWREPAREGRMPGGGNYVVVATS